MIYGIDAVHGHNNVINATIFPHNIGLGATRQVKLTIFLTFLSFELTDFQAPKGARGVGGWMRDRQK